MNGRKQICNWNRLEPRVRENLIESSIVDRDRLLSMRGKVFAFVFDPIRLPIQSNSIKNETALACSAASSCLGQRHAQFDMTRWKPSCFPIDWRRRENAWNFMSHNAMFAISCNHRNDPDMCEVTQSSRGNEMKSEKRCAIDLHDTLEVDQFSFRARH